MRINKCNKKTQQLYVGFHYALIVAPVALRIGNILFFTTNQKKRPTATNAVAIAPPVVMAKLFKCLATAVAYKFCGAP